MTQTRATCTLGHAKCTPANLAQHIHCVARHSQLDAHALAERIGCSYDWFIKVTSDGGRAAAPAWLCLTLAVLTGRTDHLAYQAHEAGLLTFHPSIGPAGRTPALSPLVRRFAAVVEEFEAMHADGQVTADEARAYTHAVTTFIAQLLAGVNEARQQAGLDDLTTPTTKEPA